MKEIAVFLDRDGTLIKEEGYLSDPEKVEILPYVSSALKKLNKKGLKVIIVSNQSGVARNYFSIKTVEAVMNRMTSLLKDEGAFVDDIFYCPHLPQGQIPEYAIDCNCRKPKIGLMEKAAEKYSLDLSKCYMIGDKEVDVYTGHRFGGKGILVLSGYGKEVSENKTLWEEQKPDFIAENILEAIEWILQDLLKEGKKEL